MDNLKLNTQHSTLALIVLSFVALAMLYSVVTPLGEGPDEPGHARYMFFLAREGRLPAQQAAGQSDVPGEGHQPPLAYVLIAPLASWLPREERQFDMPGNSRFTWAGPSSSSGHPAELNAVAHGSREYMPWRGFVLAWHLARLVSVALGAATVVFTYLTARVLADERRTTKDQSDETSFVLRPSSFVPLLAAALVAFNPQFLFISALVTNDALLVTLSAALLWLAVRRCTATDPSPPRFLSVSKGRAGDRRPTTDDGPWTIDRHQSSIVYRLSSIRLPIKDAIMMGVVLGLALITKQSAIILAPVAFLAVLEQSRSVAAPAKERAGERASGRSGLPTSPLRRLTPLLHQVVSLLVFVVVTLLVSGWWYARNWRLYGDLFGLAAFQAEFITQPFEVTRGAAWLAALGQLHDSFWARFGWMNVLPPGWVVGVFALLELLALLGWLRYADQRRRTNDERGLIGRWSLAVGLRSWWPILALPLLAFGWIVSFALTAGLVAWQGRLLFPALPALAIVLAHGLSCLTVGSHPKGTRSAVGKRVGIVYWLVLTGYCMLASWLPFGVIRPAYPPHTLPEAQALERLGTQVYGRFSMPNEPGAELRGWSLSGTTRPGDTPQLTLIWHALGRQNRNWTVFIHLVDAREQIVAQDNRPPQDDAFPMHQWVVGDWVEDRHPLALPDGLAPGEYRIRVGLFYPHTDRRAGMYNQRGRLRGDYLDVGALTVRS